MKNNILILTQKVDKNDDILGFFNGWIKAFARQCEEVTVICLQKGEYNLPQNVRVLSLGKEKCVHKIKYIFNFYSYIWRERKNYDAVLVHMTPIYIVLGGLPWRVWNKKIALWYTHKSVDFKLRLAEKFTHKIFTASKESFRLPSKKVRIVGHGIDTNVFIPTERKAEDVFTIITVGRISPIKDYETLLRAVELSKKEDRLKVLIVGGPGTKEQQRYLDLLVKQAKDKKIDDIVKFLGPKTNSEAVSYLQNADLFVNMSRTGSLDKAVLEAMSCGVPTLTSNVGLKSVLKDHDQLMFKSGDARELAEKISTMRTMLADERDKLSGELRAIVVKEHNLSLLVQKILQSLHGQTR